MAQLLLNWLNDEIKLSRYVQSIDDDFRNGYLLGELLFKYNQLSGFEKFLPKDTPDAKINNFCHLEPAMRQVGVNFNSKIAYEIMIGKSGTMRMLLYELRVALERIRKISNMASTAPRLTKISASGSDPQLRSSTEKIHRVVRPSKPYFDKTMATTFENSIRAMIENPNDVLMEKIVGHFKEKKFEFRRNVQLAHEQDLERMDSEFRRRRELDLQRKAHEREFAQAWEMLNVEQWKRNQRIAHDRRTLTKKVDTDLTSRTETRRVNFLATVRNDTLASIDDFDRRMQVEVHQEDEKLKSTVGKALRKVIAADPSRGIPELNYINNTYLHEGLIVAQKTMKEQKEDSSEKQSVHGQRRRKFVREREASHTSSLQKVAASEIVNQLLNPCQSEIFEDRYMRRVMAYKGVFSENRLNRNSIEEQIYQNDEQRQEQWAAEVATREFNWVVSQRMASQAERFAYLEEATMSADLQGITEMSHEIVERLLDMTDWVISCRALGFYDASAISTTASYDTGRTATTGTHEVTIVEPKSESAFLVPEEFWRDAKAMFVSALPIAAALPLPVPTNVYYYLPDSLSEKPNKVDALWLLQKPFKAHFAMPYHVDNSTYSHHDRTCSSPTKPDDDATCTEESDGPSAKARTEGCSSSRGTSQGDIVSKIATTISAETTDTMASTAPSSRPITSLQEAADDPIRVIAEHLADCDVDKFINRLAGVKIADYDSVPVLRPSSRPTTGDVKAAAMKASSQMIMAEMGSPGELARYLSTPQWIFDTPPKYVLGEIVVIVRSLANEADKAADRPSSSRGGPELKVIEYFNNGVSQSGEQPLVVGPMAHAGSASVEPQINAVCDPSNSSAGGVSANGESRSRLSSSQGKELVPLSFRPGSPILGTAAESGPVSRPFSPPEEVIFTSAQKNIRIALSGPSDLARKTVAEAVKAHSGGGVKILRVEDLVLKAAADGETARKIDPTLYDETQALAVKVLSSIESGGVIDDHIYVSLLAAAIKEIEKEKNHEQKQVADSPEEGVETDADQSAPIAKGFIIEDFPNSKAQAVLLFQKLSGINYDTHKPQRSDFASPFAPPKPCVEELYDGRLCGLDAVYFLNSVGDLEVTAERITVRRNAYTGEIIYLNGEQSSVDGLDELITPLRPAQTSSIEIALMSRGAEELKEFLNSVGVLRSFELGEYLSLEEAANAVATDLMPLEDTMDHELEGDVDNADDGANEVMVVTDCMQSLALAQLDRDDLSGSQKLVKEVELSAPVAVQPAAGSGGATNAPSSAELRPDSPGMGIGSPGNDNDTKVPSNPCPMPVELARSLKTMWNIAESQSRAGAKHFFGYLRDARYIITQRRRALHDAVKTLLVRRDNRQDLLNTFLADYNSIDQDFRFDSHCAAELFLRALELRESMLVMCLQRQTEAEELVKKAESDGIVKLLVHVSECEAASLLQVEFNRFTTSLHLIFDYTKAITGYDTSKRVLNQIEEALEPLVPTSDGVIPVREVDAKAKKEAKSKDGKGAKGKKDKNAPAAPVPYREAVPPVLLSIDSMQAGIGAEIEASTEIDAAHANNTPTASAKRGAKPSANAKKVGATGTSATAGNLPSGSSPLTSMEKMVQEVLAGWDKESFSLQRQLYDENEFLCQLIETAIWHEAERLKHIMSMVREAVDDQREWLQRMETELSVILHEAIGKRYVKEAAVVERLSIMIGEAIEAAEPIRHQWLLAPDAIVVMNGVLLVPLPEPPPEPEVIPFFTDRLNAEQADVFRQWLEQVAVGNSILEEDLSAALDRSLSNVGPTSCVVSTGEGIFSHVTLPRKWRERRSDALPVLRSEDEEAALDPSELEFGVQGELTAVDAPQSAAPVGGLGVTAPGPTPAVDRGHEMGHEIEFVTASRGSTELAREALVRRQKVNGIDEHSGVASLSETIDRVMQPELFYSS